MAVSLDLPTQTAPSWVDPNPIFLLAGDNCRLAIIGSQRFVNPDAISRATKIIREEIETCRPQVCISGGCPNGIDTLFREIAEEYGYTLKDKTFIEHLPREDILRIPSSMRWGIRGGYKDRNVKIANDCSRCVAIRCHASRTYGSGWTVDLAEKLKKSVRREIL